MYYYYIYTIILILYLQQVYSTKVGDKCCVEDWEKEIEPIYKSLKIYSEDLNKPEFLTIFNKWNSSLLNYINDNSDVEALSEGICSGRLSFICQAPSNTKDPGICVCNQEPPLYFKDYYGDCVAEDAEDLCYNYLDTMKCGHGLECTQNHTEWTGPFNYCIYSKLSPPSTVSNTTVITTPTTTTSFKFNITTTTTTTEKLSVNNSGSYKMTGWLFLLFLIPLLQCLCINDFN